MGTSKLMMALPLTFLWGCSGQIGDAGPDGLGLSESPLPGSGAATGTTGPNGVPGANGAVTSTGGAGANTTTGLGGGTSIATGTAGATVVVTEGVFPAAPMVLDGEPLYTRFLRLTNDQWERAVQDILQLSAPPDKARTFQTAIVGATDFVNNETVLQVTNDLWQQYELAAEEVVLSLTGSDAAIQKIYSGTDSATFIRTLGRRAYRRPLTDAEVTAYQAVFDTGSGLEGTASAFTIGAGLVIEAMLQSPHFIYRTELGTDGKPLSGYEMASKLSFFLRGTTPSDALLDQAAAGDLDDTAGIQAAAEQMLSEPGALELMRAFHGELFEFYRFDDVTKDVPEFNSAINAELKEASYLFFERLLSEGLGVQDLLTTTKGYVGPLLADLYGVSKPTGGRLALQELGPERAGYFSQIPFLLLYGDNEHSDAIHRGVHINFDVLCAKIPPPPVAVAPLDTSKPANTDRERVVAGTSPCGDGCHDAYLNVIGFAFENFDGMGRLRTMDNGHPVNTAAAYPFVEGTVSYANSQELMTAMASTEMAHACYAKHLAGYALQREIAASDADLIASMTQASLASNSSVKQMIVDLVTAPTFAVRNGGGTQ